MNGNSYGGYGRDFRRNNTQRTVTPKAEPQKPHIALTEDNYVDQAQHAIEALIQNREEGRGKNTIVSTSKLRNLLAMTADIYNDVILSMEEELPADVRERINYLKVRFIYESGRVNNDDVKKMVSAADILRHLQDIGNSRKRYLLFSRYMEALVAYRKYLADDRDE